MIRLYDFQEVYKNETEECPKTYSFFVGNWIFDYTVQLC